jgi:hypothetical protein
MLKCPFCQFANEDGALFCEQCKSDLGVLESPAPLPSAQESAEFIRTMANVAPIPEAHALEDSVRPVPVAIPVEPARSAPVIPVAAAVTPAQPVHAAGIMDPRPAGSSKGKPKNSDDAPPQPSPTVPQATEAGATISSVETFMGPSHAPSGPSTAKSAVRLTKDTDLLPVGGNPRLVVLRGQKINVEYPLYEGDNYIGRADEKPVDIDLEDQEPPDRIWSSRQHALIRSEDGILTVEDLNSSNGTFINRTRLYPGQKRVLNISDIVQIGTVQMKVVN